MEFAKGGNGSFDQFGACADRLHPSQRLKAHLRLEFRRVNLPLLWCFHPNAHGTECHPQKMKHAKGEWKARPSHPPLAGRLLICSLRSAITRRSERVVSQ
jgi:hypothetical protein